MKIKVYCGLTIQDKCGKQLHPLNDVLLAKEICNTNEPIDIYSNSPDFVFSMKYIAEAKKLDIEFFLDGISQGNDIDNIFCDFNRSIDLHKEILDTYDI